ncbi:MAG: metallophosphoesterase [Clostridia bacterium]|nr:metallophosphoesterase [Clostridia bacterium]
MKILVISDSHGAEGNLFECLEKESDANYVIFLGDGLKDIESFQPLFSSKTFYMVQGNCDFFSPYPTTTSVNISGKNVVFTHGHNYSVKQSLSTIKSLAKANEADICLFGHTHVPFYDFYDGCLYLNPGSINENKANKATYAVIEIKDNKILPSIREI